MEKIDSFDTKERNKCVYVIALGGTIASLAVHNTDELYKSPTSSLQELLSQLPLDDLNIRLIHEQLNALSYDGHRNLFNSLLLASSSDTVGLGVLLSFNDCIIGCRDAFKLGHSIVNDFCLNGIGLVGYIQGKNIHINHVSKYKHTYHSEFDINTLQTIPKVFIIHGHLGIDSTFIEAAINADANGIISIGMGNGHQPKKITEALGKASQKGILVVRCSKVLHGVVSREKTDSSYNFITGNSLSPLKARIYPRSFKMLDFGRLDFFNPGIEKGES